MCLCSKYNKLYSAEGKYHGRPMQLTKLASPQMVKKTPKMYGLAPVNHGPAIAFRLAMVFIDPPTVARHGHTSVCRIPSASRRS